MRLEKFMVTLGSHRGSSKGWSISFLYTLIGMYDKNYACSKKIGIDLCSVHPEISFDNKKSEQITDISCHNRNNRNNNNSRNKQQTCSKWIPLLLDTKLVPFSVI